MEKSQKGSTGPTPSPPETAVELPAEPKPEKHPSVQERWAQSAKEGAIAGGKLTDSQALAQARRNSGYVATAKKTNLYVPKVPVKTAVKSRSPFAHLPPQAKVIQAGNGTYKQNEEI